MSATVSGRSRSILIKVCNSLLSNTAFALLPKPPIFQCSHCFNTSSSSNRKCDYLEDFSPLKNLNSEDAVISPNERRRIILGLGKLIKKKQGFVLKKFSRDFRPFLLVKIMTQFENRHGAFAFFKFVFREESDRIVKSCCVACHVLAMHGFRIRAQDVLSWMIRRIGVSRGQDLMEFMWRGHFGYESDFSVLDSLMRAFTNAEMDSHALQISRIMRGLGMQPCLSALSILFKLLLRIGDYGSVWKLFRDMIRKGPFPSNIAFNVMIHGFCRKGQVQTGESLLHLMSKFQCEPDVYTYNILINAYCIHGRTSDVWSWVDLMVKRGCTPNTATFSTIINALSKEGKIKEARDIFDEMQENGVSPNTIVYNALMDGFVKAKEIDKATDLFEDMKNNHIKADGVTYNILVSGYHKYERVENLDNSLSYLNRSMCGPLSDYSWPDVTVAILCSEGRTDEATKHLEDMLKEGLPLSVIAFNSIICAYSKKGLETKAFDAYHMMMKYGLTPSSSTCNSLLMCLSRNGKLLEAEELMHYMIQNQFPVNKVAFTVIIDGYFKIGDVMGAQRLWAFMKSKSISPDTVAFSAYIDGLSKSGLVEEAYNVFLQMKNKGVFPNNFTYNSLIAGFCNVGRLNEALKLEKEMIQMDLIPDLFTINILINGYCKQGRMKYALDTYTDMHRFNLVPDIVTYNTLLSGYCKAFDMDTADNLVYKMYTSGWDPDITTYNIRIHGFFVTRKMKKAVLVLNQLLSSGIVPNTITYNTMLNAVCSDIHNDAMILTAKLLKMAFVPNIVTTNLLLSHLRKQRLPQMALKWVEDLKELCLEFDEVTYKILERADCDVKERGDQGVEEDAVYISEEGFFIDFFMHLTYDYLCRNKFYSSRRMIKSGSGRSCNIEQPMLEVNNFREILISDKQVLALLQA
uniref:Pentatricopeptide repeat-containing protein-mitochondrial domain-containing protein n=1 Tax=Lactuca sativa TaxID=4236 RepID=A0A9R1XEY9_LACSA|nr:hypothetical protein LSAT_V11C400172440 [Lactuca sativa]